MINEKQIYSIIGKRIKYFREKAGFTQSQLAIIINKSRASFANYENGDQAIYISDLYHLANHLEIDLYEFLPTFDELKEKVPENILKDIPSKDRKEILGFINTLEEAKNNE